MYYIIRKTQLIDVDALPAIERSAGTAFKSLLNYAWVAEDSVMSVDDHKRIIADGFSWVAVDTLSQTIAGFMTAKITEGEFYIGEVSVVEAFQKQGIGSKLFETALSEAKRQGLPAATLTTFKDVPWNAPYYEKLGFAILPEDSMPLYLQSILQKEEAAGLPRGRRCAMRKVL